MQPETRPLGLRGFLIDSPDPGRLRGVRDGALVIEDGRIAACGSYESVRATQPGRDIRWMHSPETVLIPGLIDLHAHLPQYPAVARHAAGAGSWLQRQIVPLEKQFRSAAARTQAPAYFAELAKHGTTCAMLAAAVFEDSTEAAFSAAEQSGLRITMGKVMMDAGPPGGHAPEKSADQSCAESESLCRKWNGRNDGLIHYAFAPRSVLCTGSLLRRAAELAEKHGAALQMPLGENSAENEAVRSVHPDHTGAIDLSIHCGVAGPRAVLSHCVALSDEEIVRIAGTGAAVAHCPTTDFFLGNGLMRLDRMRAAGLRIGLGSGVGAGPEVNLWQVMRSAVEAQKARHFHDNSIPVPGIAEIFHLATQGGADALGRGDQIGSFEIGKDADVAVIDLAAITPYGRKLNPHAHLTAEDIITLLVYRGNAAAVIETFVRGRSVHRAPAPMLV